MPRKKTQPEPTAAEVRTWARENGLDVGTRGRIAPALVEQFKAAQKGNA